MEGANDSRQQQKPEEQATDGKEKRGSQQPEMELCDDRQGLARGSLHHNGPTGIRDGNSAEKPILPIASRPQTRSYIAVQRLVGSRQFVQYRPQDLLMIGCSYEFTTPVDDADDESPVLALLRLDNSLQGVTQLNKREAGRDDAHQFATASAYRLGDNDTRVVGRFSRDAHVEDRAGGLWVENLLDDAGRREFCP